MIAPTQVALVQKSWRQVTPISATAAELFYGKLFSLDPALKPLFKGDMKEQGRKLMTMISTAVSPGPGNSFSSMPHTRATCSRSAGFVIDRCPGSWSAFCPCSRPP